MRKGISFLLFFILFCGYAYAEIITIQGGCYEGVLYKSTPRVTGSVGDWESDACLERMNQLETQELAKPDYSGGTCAGSRPFRPTLDCQIVLLGICCNETFVTNKPVKEDSIIGSGTITGVPIGDEKTVAEQYFQSFNSGNAYIDHTADGYVRTDGLTGYLYTSSLGDTPDTATVTVDVWKRGGYGKSGEVLTLEALGAGSSGTGIDYTQMTGSVSSGIANSGALTKLNDIKVAIEAQGANSAYSGPTSDQIGSAVAGHLDVKSASDPSAQTYNETAGSQNSLDNSEGMGTYSDIPVEDSITSKVTGFLSSNPLMSIFNQSSVTASGEICSFSTNLYGGNVEISFCDLGSILGIFGTLLLSVATIYSLYIALGRA